MIFLILLLDDSTTKKLPQSFFCSDVSQETGLKVGQEASFAVQLNGARGLIDAKVHTPSGAVEECCITELDGGEFTEQQENHERVPVKRQQNPPPRVLRVSLQTSMPSGSSPEKMEFTPSTSASVAATYPAVPSRSGWERSDRREIQAWCPPSDRDWREERRVNWLQSLHVV